MPERRDMLPTDQAHQLIDDIPAASNSAAASKENKRKRDFEKEHPTFSYRLTDKEIHNQIVAVAESLVVPVDDVARAFAQAGIAAAHSGKIPLNDIPLAPKRLTLFPTDHEKWEVREEAAWPREIPVRKKKRMQSLYEKKQRQKEVNQFRVSYRWPVSIDEQLDRLVEQLIGRPRARSDGRKGWLLTILFRYSLQAYQTGRLPLEPKTRVVRQGLQWR